MANSSINPTTLRWGLALKKILDDNKKTNLAVKAEKGRKEKSVIDSYDKLELDSEVTKQSIIKIIYGRIAAVNTTWMSILNALKISLTEFAKIHDAITEEELAAHHDVALEKAQQKKPKASSEKPNKTSKSKAGKSAAAKSSTSKTGSKRKSSY